MISLFTPSVVFARALTPPATSLHGRVRSSRDWIPTFHLPGRGFGNIWLLHSNCSCLKVFNRTGLFPIKTRSLTPLARKKSQAGLGSYRIPCLCSRGDSRLCTVQLCSITSSRIPGRTSSKIGYLADCRMSCLILAILLKFRTRFPAEQIDEASLKGSVHRTFQLQAQSVDPSHRVTYNDENWNLV